MGDKFWMVYGEGQNSPRFKHETYDAAQTEAERLARSVMRISIRMSRAVFTAAPGI